MYGNWWHFLRVFCSIMGMCGVIIYVHLRFNGSPDSPFLWTLVTVAVPFLIAILFKIVYSLFGIDDDPFRKKKEDEFT